MRWSSPGSAWLSAVGGAGAVCRIASNTMAAVLPVNGCRPVAIS